MFLRQRIHLAERQTLQPAFSYALSATLPSACGAGVSVRRADQRGRLPADILLALLEHKRAD